MQNMGLKYPNLHDAIIGKHVQQLQCNFLLNNFWNEKEDFPQCCHVRLLATTRVEGKMGQIEHCFFFSTGFLPSLRDTQLFVCTTIFILTCNQRHSGIQNSKITQKSNSFKEKFLTDLPTLRYYKNTYIIHKCLHRK